jgi:tetratricopeptide (TPR) repeat protein
VKHLERFEVATRAFQLLVVVTLMVAAGVWTLPTQAEQQNESVRKALFGGLELRLVEADTADLAVLSPGNYEEAQKSYAKAKEDFERGRSLDEIEKGIADSQANLSKAFESAEVAKQLLEEPLTMRSDLASYNIPPGHAELQNAEKKLVEAAQEAEDGNVQTVRNKADEAAREYRKATLKILKDEWWKQTEREMKQLKDTVEKDRYKSAEVALKAIEDSLKSMRETTKFSVGDLLRDTRYELDAVLAQLR